MIKKFCSSEKGVAAVEFALTFSFWMIILLGAADCAYALIVNQRVDRVAYSVTDLITQSSTFTKTDLNTMFSEAEQLMEPYGNFPSSGYIIVSSVYRDSSTNATTIKWQQTGGGTYKCGTSSTCGSLIGSTGGTPKMPNSMALNTGDNVIVVEVFYNFKPLFVSEGLFPSGQLYRATVYKPRLSTFLNAPS